MEKAIFRTNTLIPLDAFTTFGVNHKPNSVSPFGYFGTGLKYAVAVILRNGGSFVLWRDGIEYEFYLHDKDFRGKDFQQVRMRKRKRGMLSWMKSVALPFTTELGKNWKLWQAYRELESNTRDENGESCVWLDDGIYEPELPSVGGTGETIIVIECSGLHGVIEVQTEVFDERFVRDFVFLDSLPNPEPVFEDDRVTIYKGASRHLYYQGIRVYTPRNPCRFTYDFKPGSVVLSEDRSASNIWDLQYYLSQTIQSLHDFDLLEEMLVSSHRLWFETDDLTYYSHSGNEDFNAAVTKHSSRLGRAALNFHRTYLTAPDKDDETSVTLTNGDWEQVLIALDNQGMDKIAGKIKEQVE